MAGSRPPGNPKWVKGGPSPNPAGRPARAVELEYLDAMRRVVTAADWESIAIKVKARADEGERWAVEWLGEYLLPTATARERLALAANAVAGGDCDLSRLTADELASLTALIQKAGAADEKPAA